jgi:hypothetical protein
MSQKEIQQSTGASEDDPMAIFNFAYNVVDESLKSDGSSEIDPAAMLDLVRNIFNETLKYDISRTLKEYLRLRFNDMLSANRPSKYQGWAISITAILSDEISERYKVMGPSRDTRNKVASFGLHIDCHHVENAPRPSTEFVNVLFDALEELYREKFKMENPRLATLRAETLRYVEEHGL